MTPRARTSYSEDPPWSVEEWAEQAELSRSYSHARRDSREWRAERRAAVQWWITVAMVVAIVAYLLARLYFEATG